MMGAATLALICQRHGRVMISRVHCQVRRLGRRNIMRSSSLTALLLLVAQAQGQRIRRCIQEPPAVKLVRHSSNDSDRDIPAVMRGLGLPFALFSELILLANRSEEWLQMFKQIVFGHSRLPVE